MKLSELMIELETYYHESGIDEDFDPRYYSIEQLVEIYNSIHEDIEFVQLTLQEIENDVEWMR